MFAFFAREIAFINGNCKFEQWQSEYQNDIDSVIENPKIKNIEEYDFSLSADSPAYALVFEEISKSILKSETK